MTLPAALLVAFRLRGERFDRLDFPAALLLGVELRFVPPRFAGFFTQILLYLWGLDASFRLQGRLPTRKKGSDHQIAPSVIDRRA